MSVIAISRGSLSAAVKLAEGLRGRLGGKVVTREQVVIAAEPYGLQETGLSEKDIVAQHPAGFWERYADARKHYLTCFQATMLDLAWHESDTAEAAREAALAGVQAIKMVKIEASAY